MRPVDEAPIASEPVGARLEALTLRLRAAAERAGRDPDAFRIVGITKGFGVEMARAAVAAGLTRLGENRVQEALPKVEALPAVEWHLVGHLQSNKARPAVRAFGWIHSIDDLDLLRRLDGIAHDESLAPAILLQVNLTAEASKSGFDGAWFAGAIGRGGAVTLAARQIVGARLRGLMTIARAGAGEAEARDTFRRLRQLRDRLADALGSDLPELSMGMTADAEPAVVEGATIVRVGTALFGPRPG
ncbi:MAG TPA: YggS family pyridoxal phosphate-dependent enzyme [Candidatus Limnocylindria bacterium]|nr:YggS family pyridoxal phosphate-dependent enzyme [Candidatus Limnocylindria bacterium]